MELFVSCTQEVRIFRSNDTTAVAGDITLPFRKVVPKNRILRLVKKSFGISERLFEQTRFFKKV